MELDIEEIESGNLQVLGKTDLIFSATGVYQELSIGNGWGNEFIALSRRFDLHYSRMKDLLS
jgi:hypothetical protein